jgi:hypothetical protein
LSKMVKKPLQMSTRLPCMISIAPSPSPRKACWSPTLQTSLRAPDPCEELFESLKSTGHGPRQVSWHSLAGHSSLQWRYRQWKPLCWDFSDPLLLPPVSPTSSFDCRL